MTAYGLTPEMLKAFMFIERYVIENGFPPNYDEIRVAMGLGSKGGVHRYVQELKDRGLLDTMPNCERSIRIIRRPDIGITFLPAAIKAALEEHCAKTGEKPFDVLCDGIQLHLDECERIGAG